jgi:tetratricopeptide (TPR) repeat protein
VIRPVHWQTTTRLASLLFATALLLPCTATAENSGAKTSTSAAVKSDARRARSALERGQKAEAARNWEEALADYEEASQFAPGDMDIARKREAARAWIVRLHADSAERLALQGDVAAAQGELRAALKMDPGNDAVKERLMQLQALADVPPQTGPALAGAPRLEPRSGDRDFDIRGDTQSAYQEVAAAFGVFAAFDPDVVSRPVRLRVTHVDFATMMGLVGTETGTFWSPVDATTFFVAPDTQQKRRDVLPIVEQTFILSDTVSPEEVTDLQRALREISGTTHIDLDTRSRTITVKDTPQTVALAGELIRQLGQARGEVMLEIEILEVDRNRAKQLGITPPTQFKIFTVSPTQASAFEKALQANDLSTAAAILQQILGTAAAFNGLSGSQLLSAVQQTGLGTVFPPFVAIGGGKSIFLLNMPGTALNLYETLSLVRDGKRVLMRVQDGKPATFFVGERFPVMLSLLTASTGTGTISTPTVTSGVFPRSDFSVGSLPDALVAQDFNGDGLNDLAIANHDDNTVSILLNQGAGTGNFVQPSTSPFKLAANETGPVAIASGIFREATGFADLVVVNQSSDNLAILQGDGTGGFAEASNSPLAVGHGPGAIAVGQFNINNNSHLDLAVVNSIDDTLTVLLGDGAGGFTLAPNSPSPLQNGEQALPLTTASPCGITSADFNRDGIPDLAVVCGTGTANNVAVLLGTGDGTFTPAAGSPIAVGRNPVAIAAGDLNGDGQPDLAVVNLADNTVTVLLNQGGASFLPSADSPLTTGSAPSGVAIADFDSNGFGDLAVTNFGDNTLSLFLGEATGGFITPFNALPTQQGPTAIVASGLGGRGASDVALTERTSDQASVFLNPLSSGAAAASALQQAFPGSEYVDLGLKVKATPTVHPNGEVTLHLEFEIRALTGDSEDGIPIISNRTIDQTVRLKEDETAIVFRLLDREETQSLSGLPGLLNVPVLGNRQAQLQDTEMLVFVTPRLLRLPPHQVRALYAGRGDNSTRGGAGSPGPTLPAQPFQPPPPRQTPPNPQIPPLAQPPPSPEPPQ